MVCPDSGVAVDTDTGDLEGGMIDDLEHFIGPPLKLHVSLAGWEAWCEIDADSRDWHELLEQIYAQIWGWA